jgi:hypothetical protein
MNNETFKDPQTGKYGFRNKETGEIVIAPKYDNVGIYERQVCIDGKWGMVDSGGEALIPPAYDKIWQYNSIDDSHIYASLNGKEFVFDYEGNKLQDWKIEELKKKKDTRLLRIEQNGKMGYVNGKYGEICIPPKFDWLFCQFTDDKILFATLNGKCGLINKTGAEITPMIYDAMHESGYLPAAFKLDVKWGFIDETGATVIPFQYDYVSAFSFFGKAIVYIDGRGGVIDRKGNEVLPLIYDEVTMNFQSESKRQILAKLNGEKIYFDREGNRVE